jgi:hypothetical protein
MVVDHATYDNVAASAVEVAVAVPVNTTTGIRLDESSLHHLTIIINNIIIIMIIMYRHRHHRQPWLVFIFDRLDCCIEEEISEIYGRHRGRHRTTTTTTNYHHRHHH